MLKILKISNKNIQIAKKILPQDYVNALKNKSDFYESIVARQIIFKNLNILPKVDLDGIPIFDGKNFWSISHKKGTIFVGTYFKPIGIDIEIIIPRGNEVFELHKEKEYKLFGGKNLKTFYKLWVLKESVIKLNLDGISNIADININYANNFEKLISGIKFQYKFGGNFRDKLFFGYIGAKKNIIYSISYFI